MKNKMTVFNSSSINADSIKIVVTNGDNKLFEHTYHYGYDVSWKKDYATKTKPFDKDLIAAIAEEFEIKPEDIEYAKGVNVFQQSMEAK